MLFGREARLTVVSVLIALGCLFGPAEASAGMCESNNPDEIPPFITRGVDPNLLMIIDNSGSMYDLAYVTNAGYCFDGIYEDDQGQMVESYQNTNRYAGYFDPDGWYAYDFTSERFTQEAPETGCENATHCKGESNAREVCLTISTETVDGEEESSVTSFAARGNYLNWAAASKMDIEKGILTGGKHEDSNLIMESRGCVEMRFVRETYIDLAGSEGQNDYRLTVAVRQPSDEEKSGNPDDYTTRIEIFPVMAASDAFNHGPCQDAADEMRKESPNLGNLKDDIDNCLDYSDYKPNDPEVASQSAFNQSVQTCWFIVKQEDPDSISTGDISRIMNSCQNVYEGDGYPGVDPVDLDPSHSGYVCFGDIEKQKFPDDNPVHERGYVGRCWDHSEVDWKANGKIENDGWVSDDTTCVESALLDFCGVIDVPVVTDPSDQVTGVGDDTGEFWNLPAMLVDSGVIWQLGQPLAVLKGRVAYDDTPSGLLQEFANDLRIGAMVFNWDGAEYECELPGAPGTYACDEGVRDGGRVIASIGKGDEHTQALVDAVNDIVADTWTPLSETMYNAIGYFAQDKYLRLSGPDDPNDFTIYGGNEPITDWCQLNNILLITDGAPTADRNQKMIDFAEELGYSTGVNCPALHGSTYLRDLTQYAYEDIWLDRTFPEGEEWQTVTTHVVAVGDFRDEGADLCSPDMLLQETAASGGTELYKAETLDQLETALREAFGKIRAGAAAGSAASVISATRSGEGAVYQAIFWPEKSDSAGRTIQ
ncbi:MAG: hypothetical protein R6V25_05645, partial [Desulfatiglandales bacterium]